MKYSRAIVENLFKTFIRAIGAEVGIREGQYRLDYAPQYGGYTIVLMCENGGESTYLFGPRRGPKEMANTLRFAIDALNLTKGA